LVLVKAVLQIIHVYWLSLAKVPTSILNKIQHLMANFVWKGAYKTTGFHLTKWQDIAIPKEFGGWGIMDIFWIAKSLIAKYFWRGLFGNNIWSQILKSKYLKGIDLTSWIRGGIHKSTMASTIWKHFLCSLPLIKQWLAWHIGSGNQVVIGKDPFIGDSTYYKLSDPLIYSLNTHNIFSIAQATFPITPNSPTIWKIVIYIGLTRPMLDEWKKFITLLQSNGISLQNTKDKLVWSWNRHSGSVTANLAYHCIARNTLTEVPYWWYKAIWKFNVHNKITYFIWLCLKDGIRIGANYRKRGGIGPAACNLCLQDDETTQHLLIHCKYTQLIWKEILNSLNITDAWNHITLEGNLL